MSDGRPLPMDYDGDGKAEFTVMSAGAWHFFNDDGSYNKGIWVGDVAGDVAVPADYDGDGKEDPVVFRAGAWLFFSFADGTLANAIWTGAPPPSDGSAPLPSPLDYDGDGRVDLTVYSKGPWHFYNADGTYNRGVWTGEVAGDQPLSRRMLP